MKQKTNVTLRICGLNYTGDIHRYLYASADQSALRFIDPNPSDDGPNIATLTVCMVGEQCGRNEVFIKNYSENEGVLDELVKAGIVRPIRSISAGHAFGGVTLCEIIAPELREAAEGEGDTPFAD